MLSNILLAVFTLTCCSVATPTSRRPSHPKASSAIGSGPSVPTGTVINAYTVPSTVALAFDGGPHNYTVQLLDILREHHTKATLFLNGQDWYPFIDFYKDVVVQEFMEGHQLASHTLVDS